MNKNLKFVWDFYGTDSEKTANHSLSHIQEFLIQSKINIDNSGVEKVSENHFYSFIVLNIKHLEFIKNKLKPTRAFKY